jgi:hypothetical protein
VVVSQGSCSAHIREGVGTEKVAHRRHSAATIKFAKRSPAQDELGNQRSQIALQP